MRKRGARWDREAAAAVLFILLPVLASPRPGPLRTHGLAARGSQRSNPQAPVASASGRGHGHLPRRVPGVCGALRGHLLHLRLRDSAGSGRAVPCFAAGPIAPLPGEARARSSPRAFPSARRAAAVVVSLGHVVGSGKQAPRASRASTLLDAPPLESWRPTGARTCRASTAAWSKREGVGDDSEKKKVSPWPSLRPMGTQTHTHAHTHTCVRAYASMLQTHYKLTIYTNPQKNDQINRRSSPR
jgi:hypothetical protein